MASSTTPPLPTTMKAVVVREVGDVDALQLEMDCPLPTTIPPGNVLVRNRYAGLNFIDTYYRTGLYKQPVPFCVGQEGGGTIVALGTEEGGSTLQVGQEVVYTALVGCYCEYSVVPASKCILLPTGLSMEDALACLVQGLTAHYLVTDATARLIQPNEWCLIYSVGSGTGQWAAQMAKLQGYKVIGTTSRGKEEGVPKHCIDELIVLDSVGNGNSYADYTSVDIVATVMKATNGQGVKCILDGIGKATSEISISCIARRGIWVSFGNASGAVPPFSVLQLTPKSAFVTRPKLGDYVATRDELQRRLSDIFGWVRDKKLTVKIDRIFRLDEAQEAHRYLEAGKSKGKILLRIE